MTMKMFMNSQMFSLGATALLLLVVSASVFVAMETGPIPTTNDVKKTTCPTQITQNGKVVNISADKLAMTDEQGEKECTCTLADDVKVTCDGKECKTSDLKPGTKIRVTTRDADKSVANRIEGIEKNRAFASKSHDGKVISITGGKLLMTNKDGKERSHMLSADAKLTLDGKTCKATDLKPGTRIRVTSPDADNSMTNRIEGIDINPDFANNSQDGKVVSITGNQLVMAETQGGEESTCTLTADANVTCDGKVSKSSDLEPGMRIRVTLDYDEPQGTIKVEALDTNLEFASLYTDLR